MSAPWEKYQGKQSGPWAKYQAPPPEETEASPQYADPGSWLNRAADISAGAQEAVMGPVVRGAVAGAQGASRMAFGTEAPANALGRGIQAVGQGIKTGEEYVSGKLGEMGVNPYVAGAVPIAGEIAASFLLPGPKNVGATFLKPAVPAERAAAVAAAREAAVPLSRAEMTGGRLITGLENTIEKTPMGSGTMGRARAASDEAMQAYTERLRAKMGTTADPYEVGLRAKAGLEKTSAPIAAKRNEMFSAVPDEVHVPLTKSQEIADTIVKEQSEYLPTTRNSDVLAMAKDVQNAHAGISSGEGVGPNPEAYGRANESGQFTVGYKASPEGAAKLPVMDIPTTGKPHALFDYPDPITGEDSYKIAGDASQLGYKTTPNVTLAKVKSLGLDVVGKTRKAAEIGQEPAGLAAAPKSNYQLLKRLRETLSGKAQEARSSQNLAAERDYLRLRSAVDEDIGSFVKNQKTPLGSMVGKEFAESYQKANAFSGAYKKVFKGDVAGIVEGSEPEHILGMVFKKNNESAIKQFHAAVGDEAFQTAKRKWVSDILDSPNVAKELEKYEPGTLRAALSKPELDELQKYASVQGVRKTVGNLQGTQGSARTNIQLGSYGGLGYGLKSLATGDIAGAAGGIGQFVAPYPIAKALTSKAVTEGFKVAIPSGLPKAALVEFLNRRLQRKENP